MNDGVGAVLGLAVGVAISPVPVIAVILMLFTRHARVNGPVFALGWVAALGVITASALVLADAGGAATDETVAEGIARGRVVLGVGLLVLAGRTWCRRPAPGAAPARPAWMTQLDGLQPGRALAMGAALAGLNPKNLVLATAAGTSVAALGLGTGDAVVSLLVFVLVASLTVAGPVIYQYFGGNQAERALAVLRSWLELHNAAIMTVLFLVLGANLAGDGLGLLG
jgi:hypothetical protein